MWLSAVSERCVCVWNECEAIVRFVRGKREELEPLGMVTRRADLWLRMA